MEERKMYTTVFEVRVIDERLKWSSHLSEDNLTLSLPRVPLIDFTLSNTRRFYSSMGNPTRVKGLTTARFTQKLCPHYLLTLSLPRVPLIDFTLSNARRFYSSMGIPTGVKGLSNYALQTSENFRQLQQKLNPRPLWCPCNALPTDLWSHTGVLISVTITSIFLFCWYVFEKIVLFICGWIIWLVTRTTSVMGHFRHILLTAHRAYWHQLLTSSYCLHNLPGNQVVLVRLKMQPTAIIVSFP